MFLRLALMKIFSSVRAYEYLPYRKLRAYAEYKYIPGVCYSISYYKILQGCIQNNIQELSIV